MASTIQAIGRCASNIPEVTDTCLSGLVKLLSNRDGERHIRNTEIELLYNCIASVCNSFDSRRGGQAYFSACPVWLETANIISADYITPRHIKDMSVAIFKACRTG